MYSNTAMFPLGDSAIVVQLETKLHKGTHERVMALCQQLDECQINGMIEYVPAFTTVTIFYQPEVATYAQIEASIYEMLRRQTATNSIEPMTVDIPVCYGGEFGPDIKYVAEYNQLTVDEVITLHSRGRYLVHMIGFAPGFAYLGGMSERIATPRLETPRLTIPVGSVGIAGEQTGVYPIETPGGWRLIGRTPRPLFTPSERIPSLLSAGDIVQFRPISEETYRSIQALYQTTK